MAWLFVVLTGIVFGQSACHVEIDVPSPTKEYTSLDGRKVFVFDGFIPEENLLVFKTYAIVNDNWRFVLPDEHVIRNESMYNGNDGIPWKSWLDPTLVRMSNVGTMMERLVQAVDAKTNNASESKVELNEIYSTIVRRGDRTKVHKEEETKGASYTMAIYNNVVWRKNSYGEAMFYDDDDEIFAVIRAKFGRIVIWDSSVRVIFRPPSISQLFCQSITIARFSANTTKNKLKRMASYNFIKGIESPKESFVHAGGEDKQAPQLDLDKHLTLLRKNREGHVVSVFDELFRKSDLDALRAWTIRYGKYYFDDSVDVTSDNVQWIAGIKVSEFIQSNFWPVLKQLTVYISGKNTWHPYDVACNLIRNADHTRFHLDTSELGQEEMTFLLYLSPNWTANDYGETAFMETNDDSADNEYVAEVVPHYGRAVLFNGNFPHSARPPSATHYGPRYTLAVKLAATKMEAMAKMFDEEPRHEHAVYETLQEIERTSDNPRVAVAQFKMAAVGRYLMTKNVQEKLRGGGDDVGENLIPVDAEVEPGLTPSDSQLLKKMAKFHDVDSGEDVGPENATPPPETREGKIFAPERRAKIFRYWMQIAKSIDELDDFLELYLKQRDWFRNYAARGVLTLL